MDGFLGGDPAVEWVARRMGMYARNVPTTGDTGNQMVDYKGDGLNERTLDLQNDAAIQAARQLQVRPTNKPAHQEQPQDREQQLTDLREAAARKFRRKG